MFLAIRLFVVWLFESINFLNLGDSWWLSSMRKGMALWQPWWIRASVANMFLCRLNPLWLFLNLVVMNFNLGYLGIIIFLSFLSLHLFLYLCNFIDDSCVCWKSWIISISSIAERVGTTTTILVARTVHWAFYNSVDLLFLGLVKLFRLSDEVLEFLQKN